MKHTDAWPLWDGTTPLEGRRIRLDYPNGRAYAVGNVTELRTRKGFYVIDGTDIWFGGNPGRVHLAPEGER